MDQRQVGLLKNAFVAYILPYIDQYEKQLVSTGVHSIQHMFQRPSLSQKHKDMIEEILTALELQTESGNALAILRAYLDSLRTTVK